MIEIVRTRPCPMCEASSVIPEVEIDRGASRFAIDRCAACGFVYVSNPSETTFDHSQRAPAVVPEKARHRQIKRVCDSMFGRRPMAGPARIAEVGAGWGGLAQVFSRDPGYRYTGFEPSAARAEFCRARGFDVREGLFRASAEKEWADAFVFDNVLEHVENPRQLVRDAVRTLRPGGALIVIVPNVSDVRRFASAWRARHYWQPHCHINYFSAADLNCLLASHGMRVRFFGFEAVGGLGDDLALLPRVVADHLGFHLLGLNVYGVKPDAS